jgi:hypothetical protein
MCVSAKEISAVQLRTFILRHCGLLGIRERLYKADTLSKIFNLIGDKCTSFFNYGIYQSIQDEFCTSLDNENPVFRVLQKLHQSSQDIGINPKIEEI